MRFKQIDLTLDRERSDRTADLLERAGIRLRRRARTESGRGRLYVITVHPDDVDRASEVLRDARRREREDLVRTLKLVRRRFAAKDMLTTREPNEAGFYESGIYHGEPFDQTRLRLVRGGWDHEHCYLCYATINPGDEWWTAHPPKHEDEIGLCPKCHARVFDRGRR